MDWRAVPERKCSVAQAVPPPIPKSHTWDPSADANHASSLW